MAYSYSYNYGEYLVKKFIDTFDFETDVGGTAAFIVNNIHRINDE